MACQEDFNYLLMFVSLSLSPVLQTILSLMHSLTLFAVQDRTLMGRITRLCDNAIALESFKGSERETNPLYKDYHGKNTHIHQSLCLFPNKVHTHTHIHTGSALRLGLGCGWRQGSPLAGQAVSAC